MIDWQVIEASLPLLGKGLLTTLKLTLVAIVLSFPLGCLIAVGRLSHRAWLSRICASFVNLLRCNPLILILFWFYFLMPVLLQSLTGAERPPQIGAERSAYITFILFEAAYFCEIMRAGIQSIAKGQAGAGYALGLNYWQVMRLIVLPQALRNMLPVLLTQAIILFQDVSLVSLLNVTDFVGAAVKVAQRDSRVVEMYLFVAVVYFVLCYSLSAAVKQLQRRIAIVR